MALACGSRPANSLPEDEAKSAMRKLSELMILTNTFRKEETDFFTIE